MSRYDAIIEKIFFDKYEKDMEVVLFERDEMVSVSAALDIKLPKNLGDVIYSYKYRSKLPKSISDTAPKGFEWILKNIGTAKYSFILIESDYARIKPDLMLATIKILDATPSIVAQYALNDEQALLTKLRYNRLIDIFTGSVCYSLQNHLRTTVPNVGQIETDEIYVGTDKEGRQYVFPVQAKGGKDEIGITQIEQDFLLCQHKYPKLICRPIAAQFIDGGKIAIFEFCIQNGKIRKSSEKHYFLVEKDQVSDEELASYNASYGAS